MPRLINTIILLGTILSGMYGNSSAFLLHPQNGVILRHRHLSWDTSIKMVFDLFNSLSDSKTQPQLPRDVKEAVSKCREATQAALKDRVSRMDIEFPVGTKFGIEKSTNKKNSKDARTNVPTKEDLERSDRELARLFVEMFQPVGGHNIVVCFNEVGGANAAKKQWGSETMSMAQIVSMDRRKNMKKTKQVQKKGFAAKLAAEIDNELDESGPFSLPNNVEVALFVAPTVKELVVVERICDSLGMGTLIVLLNARLSSIDNFGSKTGENLFRNVFQSVFLLAAASQTVAPGCLLYHTYGKNWILAQKPQIGQPKTLLVQETRPNDDDCRFALEKVGNPQIVEPNAIESAVRTVTDWLR